MALDGTVSAVPVRCSGCRTMIGYTIHENAKRNKMWCSLTCMAEPEVTEFEDRNGMWRNAVERGISPVRVARVFGAAHSLVYKTVAKG